MILKDLDDKEVSEEEAREHAIHNYELGVQCPLFFMACKWDIALRPGLTLCNPKVVWTLGSRPH